MGCSQDKGCFHNPQLLDYLDGHANSSAAKVCCCVGPMCNANYSDNFHLVKSINSTWSLVLLACLVTFIALLFLISKFWTKSRIRTNSKTSTLNKDVVSTTQEKLLFPMPEETCSTTQSSSNTVVNMNGYVIEEILHSGRFAMNYTLIQGTSQDEKPGPQKLVMKKYLGPHEKLLFTTEKLVYELLDDVRCASFLEFYGGYEEIPINGVIHRHLLSLEYVPGTLNQVMQSKTVNWSRLTQMLLDLSRGLAFLHSKRICHRNISSSNILVRNNGNGMMQCCIADFSLSRNFGHHLQQQQSHITIPLNELQHDDVRYLPPEGFENENFTENENVSKQMDIYALGLVFWELSRRCQDLYQGVAVPPFELAYQKEIGAGNPSFEQMKNLLRRGVRPLFPEVWKNTNPAIQQLKETITDSWDDDSEARLNVETIVQRVIELDPLWIKYRLHYSEAGNNSSWLNNSIATANADEFLLSHQLERNPLGLKNDNVVSGQRPSVRIQPYQGSNPCMERNIQQLADDEGNAYVTGSAKDKIKPCPRPTPVQEPRRQANFERRNPPIQYVYNNIGRTSNTSPRKKNINANSKRCQLP